MSALGLLISLLATQDCAAFTSRINEPVPIVAAPIPAEALGGKALVAQSPGARPRFAVGELFYSGYGLAITSPDPRFQSVEVREDRSARHPCGYSVDWPSGGNAFDDRRAAWTTEFAKESPERDRGSMLATTTGAFPVLEGFRVGATWPVLADGGMFFIGLMHPGGSVGETLLVAFAGRPGPSAAHVVARLPMDFERVTAAPGLHADGATYIALEGRIRGGPLNRVILELDPETSRRLGRSLADAKD